MEIHTIDHLEFYVDDAEKAAGEFCESFGFTEFGRGGPETGLAGRHTILLRQHDVSLLITSALDPAHPAGEYVRRHGSGIAVVGLAVDDAAAAYAEAVRRGAEPVSPPEVHERDGVSVTF